MESLFASAPSFDQPLAVLKHCHDRIRKQLATLEKLPPYLEQHGADAEAQKAASAVLKYFENAAPLHHDDEEIDLLPNLVETANKQPLTTTDDATLLAQLLPKILQQHQQMATQWQALALQLRAIADASTVTSADISTAQLSSVNVAAFQAIYQEHMQIEESQIAPMAMRLFSPEQMRQLGQAMQARRGIIAPSA